MNRKSHDTRAGRRRRTTIGEQFAARPIRMLRSPAWGVLSLSARRALDRIEIELAGHGGTDNGKLPVTYDDFSRYGIDRHAISPAIREAMALGFLEVTEAGRAGNAEWRKPNLFRLTYRHTDYAGPTHEWDKIQTDEEAIAIARAVRKQNPSGGKYQFSVGETHTENAKSIPEKPPLLSIPEKSPLLSISRVGVRKPNRRLRSNGIRRS
jgi:hypothetical protein